MKRHEDHLKPLLDYLDIANRESDRGKVLVALAQIDAMLEGVLKAFLVDDAASKDLLEGPNAPLGSLYSRSKAARALGLISSHEFNAINALRVLRNEFAHSIGASMGDPRIMKLAMKLTFGLDRLIEMHDPTLLDARTRFSMSAVSLISALYNRAHYVAKKKCSDTVWPQ